MGAVYRIAGTDLFEVWPPGLYCGPSALVAVTGLDYPTQLRPAINAARGASAPNRGVIGLNHQPMLDVLASFGYRADDIPFLHGKQLLACFVETLGDEPALIAITGHYVVAHRGLVVDNDIRFGCLVERHPARRRMVKRAWSIRKATQ